MTLERSIGFLFKMDNAAWFHHANPWSVILRFTVLPVLIVAFWSRLWLGWWAVIPVSLALLWTWINPRIFPTPRSFDHWTSKGVLGERVWLNRDVVPVPSYHQKIPDILSVASAIGMIFVIWGIIAFDPWPTVFGVTVVDLSKLWFVDRMVWLWNDMQDASPEYRSWQIPSGS
jgi:Family of unknown function (DUF6653)